MTAIRWKYAGSPKGTARINCYAKVEQQELIPHLFRTEYRKIVSVLVKRFGFDQAEIAEDIAADTFLAAAQSWPYKGVPPNPAAWLYNVAKQYK